MAKSYKKFMATAATTAIVVSAVAPAAMAAGFTDVTSKYKEAVDFVVSKGANGISETEFGIHENIKRVDAAVLLVNVLGLDIENAKPSGFTDVPARAVKHVNALKEAGITSGKTETTFGSHSLITRGELAVWIQKGFELAGKNEVPFTDVSNKYKKAVSALVDHGITHGVSKTEFGTTQHAKRGDYAIFLKRAAEASSKVEYKVEGVRPQLQVKDDPSTADVNETTMKFYVKAVKLSGSEIIKNPTVTVKDKDGNTVEGKAQVNTSTGEVTITGTLEDVKKGPFTLEVKVEDHTVLSTAFTVTDNREIPSYEVKSSQVVLTNTDENVLNTLFDGTVLDFGSTGVTVTDVDFTTDNETLIADNDAVKEGTVAVSTKYNGDTAIYVDTVTVNVDQTNETFVLDLNDLKVDVSLQATHGSHYVNVGIDRTKVLDYVSINMNFQNSFDKKVTGLEVSLLDADGEVVITNKANVYGLIRYVQPAVKNNGGLTTTFWEDPNQKLGSWDTIRNGSLKEAVEVQVTFTADGASYTTSEVFRQAPEYTVKSNEAVLATDDENVLNTVFNGNVLDFGSANVTVTDVDFTSDNEEIISDSDAVKEGTVAINAKNSDKTSIYVDTVTVTVNDTKETFVLKLDGLKVDVAFDGINDFNYSVEAGKTIALEDILGDNLQNIPSGKTNINVTVPADATVTWETGASHGSTPLIPEGSTVKTITLSGGGTFKAIGDGVGPVHAANEGGKLVFKDMTIVDESVSYNENAWEFGYLEFAGEVEFINCDFKNAVMFEDDGIDDGDELNKFTFTGCTFNSNKLNEYAAWISDGSASFDNCTFTGWRAIKIHEAYGSDVTSVTVDNCKFGPLHLKPGLAIGNVDATTEVTIKNSTFEKTQPGDQSNYIYESDTPVDTFKFTEENNTVIK